MKLTHLLAAGLAIATLGLGTAAPAEAQRHDRGYSQQHRDGPRGDRHYRGHDRRDDRGYRGRGSDRRNWNNGRRCRTEWRNHRRVQICR